MGLPAAFCIAQKHQKLRILPAEWLADPSSTTMPATSALLPFSSSSACRRCLLAQPSCWQSAALPSCPCTAATWRRAWLCLAPRPQVCLCVWGSRCLERRPTAPQSQVGCHSTAHVETEAVCRAAEQSRAELASQHSCALQGYCLCLASLSWLAGSTYFDSLQQEASFVTTTNDPAGFTIIDTLAWGALG